ncbi:MAG TPA: hypothetical protein VGQ64_07880 [Candidatus Limnocylindrales bacterium]|jgi:hypothetical protein|nr:hypothetical protein [Candidatus Limnocylindrales bacterium]
MTAPIIAFAREELAFPLWPGQAEILDEVYRDAIRTAVLRLGRRSGKGRVAAVVAAYESAVNAASHLAAVPAGEQVAIVVISKTLRAARAVHGFVRGFLRQAGLARLITRDVAGELELSNGIVIITAPCHAASTRGLAVAVAILDEVAWWTGTDGSPLDPAEIWTGIEPSTAQFPAGRILVLSTPRLSVGWFAELCERAASGRFPRLRAWHRTTMAMNPRIPADWFAEKEAEDPIAFRREYGAEFEAAIAAVFDPDLVRAAVRTDERPGERFARNTAATYAIAVDAAFTGDTFALLLGHRLGDRIDVDQVKGWRGSRKLPVQLDPTLDEIADLARVYRAPVVIDQYAAEPIRQGLVRRGVRVIAKPWTNEAKVDALAATRRALYAGRLSLPDDRNLVGQLIALEQRPTAGGRPRIAAPGSAHDDYASALLALVDELDPTASAGIAIVGVVQHGPASVAEARRTWTAAWRAQVAAAYHDPRGDPAPEPAKVPT